MTRPATFVCFKFRPRGFEAYRNAPARYTHVHVNTLYNMLRRYGAYRLVCVTDDPSGVASGVEVVPLPEQVQQRAAAYYPKLWGFSEELGRVVGERYAGIDLDVIVTSDPASLLERPEDFIIWDYATGERYNTSFYVLDPGARAQVWDRFMAEEGDRLARAWARSSRQRWTGDQSFVSYVLGAGEAVFREGQSGIYKLRPAYMERFPANQILAFSCGPHTPLDLVHLSPWIQERYR